MSHRICRPRRNASLADGDTETRQALAAIVAEIAVSIGPPSPAMRSTFAGVAGLLGLSAEEGERLLASAESAWNQPSELLPDVLWSHDACPTREALDRAYVQAVARYDPVTMSQFGAQMAALAAHRLMDVTVMYEADVARLEAAGATDGPA